MNDENKPAPRCPYCGAEMHLEDNEDVLFGLFADEEKMYWYQCNTPSCGIHSPANHTKVGAYRAAMKRYEEPNRVLTLDEVLEIARQNEDGYNHVCWLEEKIFYLISIPGILEGRCSRDGVYVNFDFNQILIKKPVFVRTEEYGKTWRCWMRNPTEQQMRDTPWREKQK